MNLGLLSEEKASAIRQAADEVLADSLTTNSRWLSGRPAPARKVT